MKETFFGRRHARELRRVEKKLEKKRLRLDVWAAKKDAHKITPAKFADRKMKLENEMRELSARARTLKGAIKHEHYG